MESMLGQTFDLDGISVIETDLFQYGDKCIICMSAINEETCFVGWLQSDYIEQVNKRNEKEKKLKLSSVIDVCVTDNGDLYATDGKKRSIVCLSTSDSVSTIFSTDPLVPMGICQSTEGGLLVTLRDDESDQYQPESHSRRLVRHVTLSGDVIHEYEYQENGQTRLFNALRRVKQNGNTDLCVVNGTSQSAGELEVLSISGSLRNIYSGQRLVNRFKPTDVICDSQCNIIVTDYFNSHVHLLSPDGDFFKYLLTENGVRNPSSMSLYKSTLWVGDKHGHVKVLQYNEN